ncbi:MAG: benzoate-CoA ligase family protein, partial [Acidobacteria bacterium]|nr:benzoate-CoA ligase family protein [Acidobacteriota bacterium]
MALDIPGQFNIAEYFIERPAREHPQRMAILGEPVALSYGELAVLVRRTAAALLASGCRPGDRVLIALPDSAEFIAAFFGAAKIGAVAVPVNSMTRSPDYAYYLADCGARFAIVHASALAEFLPGMLGHRPELLIVVGHPGDASRIAGAKNWEGWLAAPTAPADSFPCSCRDTAFFLYTSGSGGTPKATVHQHKDMLVCAQSYARGVLGIERFDITFSVSKLFFAYGLGNGMYFPFSVGAATVLSPERPRPEKIAEILTRHRPSVFFSVPTVYNLLLREAERGLSIDFSSVRLAVSAGEALPAEIFEQFRARFGLKIVDGIGSTEMLQMFISNRPGETRPGTCGREVPNYEAIILDETGHPVPPGEIGNLWIRGQSAFAQYWNKPELTAATKDGVRVNTGDKFFCDAEGFYHYCGRSDDMMKVSGMWVSPGEVENALLGHPLVAEAAVVAARDGSGLVRPVAYLVLRGGTDPSPQLARDILQ